MVAATSGIDQTVDPKAWRAHRFGLCEARWRVLGGRAFWITGAATGYGRALATALAAAGATVFLSGRRRRVLEKCVTEISSFAVDPARCHVVLVDITDPHQIAAAVTEIAAYGTGLHGVIHSAAIPEPSGEWPLTGDEFAAWPKLMATNVTGGWLVSRAALPLLEKSASVRILFLSSEAGWASTPGLGPYNISKAAVNSLGMSFAAETAARYQALDVQVNVLVPGEARTEMNQRSTDSPFMTVPMALALLSHPPGGPNGRFFHRDGRHLAFAYAKPWGRPLLPLPACRPEPAAPLDAVASTPSWLLHRLKRKISFK